MTGPDLPAKFGNDAVLAAATPGGLPYPISTDPANQGANAIKALALALDVAQGSPWLRLTPAAGYAGDVFARIEGAYCSLAGYLTGTVASGTLLTLPVGYRPVMPSPLTYTTAICAAVTSGNSAYATVRVWNTGAVSVTALQGAMANVDLGSIRFPVRAG
jgi:hypothetical protein